MLRTPLGRFVLCAVSHSSPQRTLLASELLLPKYTPASSHLSLALGSSVKHSSTATATAAAHAQRVPSSLSSSPTSSSPTENEATEEESTTPDPSLHFTTLTSKIHPHTLKAISHTHMSPVQAQILPLLPSLAHSHSDSLTHALSSFSSEGDAGKSKSTPGARDVLVKAKTGTGKTMAFLIPAIESRLRAIKTHIASLPPSTSPSDVLKASSSFARQTAGCLIISPTRELASQIAVEATSLTRHHKGWGVQLLLGGESKSRQLRNWEGGRKDVVVATPGRVLDLLQSERSVRDVLGRCELLILDEADTLLDMGFRDDITRLLTYLPPQPIRQTFLFSATVSRAIQQIAQASLSPTHRYINCVSSDESPVHAHIPQYVRVMKEEQADEVIPYILNLIAADQMQFDGRDGRPKSKIIIFLSTTNSVILFASLLRTLLAQTANARLGESVLPTPAHHTAVFEMHAKRDQPQRTRTSNAFRASQSLSSILLTSDVSARGVDYPGVTRVIQIGLPASLDMYVHRVGRTGRGGSREGRGDLVVMQWEEPFVKRKMAGVGLKRVGEGDVEREVREMGDVLLLDNNNGEERFGKERRAALTATARALAHAFGTGTVPATTSQRGRGTEDTDTFELVRSGFVSSAGFYAGRVAEMGLETREVMGGLKEMWGRMWGVGERGLVLPRGITDGLRAAGRREGGYGGYQRSSGGGGGGYGGGRDQRNGRNGSGGYGGRGSGGYGYGNAGGGGGGDRNAQRSSGGGAGYGGARETQRSGGSGGWGGNSQGWGSSSSSSPSSFSSAPRSSSGSGSSSSFSDYSTPSGRTGYGYDKGSRPGREYTRAGGYERAGATRGSERSGRGSDAGWERGGEGSWNSSGGAGMSARSGGGRSVRKF